MSSTRWRTVTCALALAIFSVMTSGLSHGQDGWELSFTMNNDFKVKMGDYELPEGEYRLEQIDRDTSAFMLFREESDAATGPIAMIDVWRVPDHADLADGETEATFDIRRDPNGERTPVLQGWTVRGVRWRVRDVVETGNTEVLQELFDQ